MKPQPGDIVRLLRSLHTYRLPAGYRGMVRTDHSQDSPANFEIEFIDDDSVLHTLVTLPADHIEVISRTNQ